MSNSSLTGLPASHALHLVTLVERWQVGDRELLEGFGLTRDELADPRRRLPLPTVVRLVERARALTGEPALGLYVGLQMPISVHGYLGFAAMAAATIREALDLAVRFAPTRTTAIALRVEEGEGVASLFIDERAELGSVRDVVITALMVGLWKIGSAVTGQSLRGEAELAFAEPSYHARFQDLAPGPVRFDCAANRLVFDAEILELRLPTSDAASLQLARQQCEAQLQALGFEGDLLPRLRTELDQQLRAGPTLDAIAPKLGMSPRTLKRRLSAAGTTFSEVLDGCRYARARQLLRASDTAMAEVADHLGYSDVANFSRAFRRWSGTSPAAYRDE